ncbi:hypothetical protein JJV70_18780 [Streptomyces sp. JJ66]|uniref:hypothetical protein n=1 Tax=Streptomyces sp. JJ66 TaxID=2803843 RepID=UPI001C57B56E|nr:hypothetical protein [Streptomyces sp. JJ66]MBW1604115.1 hypothetical protein [Streptomyces sp. JJ66]
MDVPLARASADLRLLRAAVFTAACVALSAAGHVFAAGAGVPLWAFGAAAALVFVLVLPLAGRERSPLGLVAALAVGQLALHTLFAGAQSHAATGSAGSAATAAASGDGSAPGGGGVGGGLAVLAQTLLCGGSGTRLSAAQARQVVADAGLGGAAGAAGPVPDAGGAAATGHAAHAASGTLDTVLGSLTAWPMLLGHLTAAVLAGWLLRCGDAALWRLVRPVVSVADGLLRALGAALACLRLLAGERAAGCAPGTGGRHDDEDGPPEGRALRHSVIRRGPPDSVPAFALAA